MVLSVVSTWLRVAFCVATHGATVDTTPYRSHLSSATLNSMT